MSIRKTEIELKKSVCLFDGQEEGLQIKKEYYGFETIDGRGYNIFSDMKVNMGVLSNWIRSQPKAYFKLIYDKIQVISLVKQLKIESVHVREKEKMSFHTFVEHVRNPYFYGEVNTTTDFAKMLDECSVQDLVKRAQQHVTNLLTAQRQLLFIKMYTAIEEYLHNDIFLLLSLVADALHNMPQHLTNSNKEEVKVELLRFYQLKELILQYISEFGENKNVKIVFQEL